MFESNSSNDRQIGAGSSATGDPSWERKILEKLAFASLKEQKAKRRWGIFFKLLGFAFFAILLGNMLFAGKWNNKKVMGAHTAVVQLRGVIDADGVTSADEINSALRSAFEASDSKAVVLAINSPGGSPVQSGLIYQEIKRLRVKYPDKLVYAVVEEMCASGGYYVAAAADKIYVDQASLVGSIGVLMDGFGFTGLMDKAGVERRLFTAGTNKGFLDPFSPINDQQKAHIQSMLAEIHQQFIDAVKKGRGKVLSDKPEITSGLVWSGAKSVELGLADGLGSVRSVARDIVKAEELIDYTPHENFADRLAKRVGASFGASVGAAFNQAVGTNAGSGRIR